MADKDSKPHLYIGNNGSRHPLKRKGSGSSSNSARHIINPRTHANRLSGQLADIASFAHDVSIDAHEDGIERIGIQITFESFEGIELVFNSLENSPKKIELLNIQLIDNTYYATVFVPEGKLTFFQERLEKYASTIDEESPSHRAVIESIAAVKRATIKTLWTDARELFPENEDEQVEWEVWLVKGDGVPEREFKKLADRMELSVSPHQINFRERIVIYVTASAAQLSSSVHLLNCVAELKKPKETAEFFDELTIEEQRGWVVELTNRLADSRREEDPLVTILDTGVNIGHPLIKPFSDQNSLFTVNHAFGAADNDGHGTNMSGLALYGDLQSALESQEQIEIGHSVESVKIINHGGDNRNKAYGAITIDATTTPETAKPNLNRIFTMAISATDSRDKGRPSAWSAAIDELCFNRIGEQDPKRLFIIASGNSRLKPADFHAYPDCLDSQPIHDPGQSWNALTVGAYSTKINLTDPNQGAPLARSGEISPYTSTSTAWEDKKPIKPDVVFEGGNVAVSRYGGFSHPSLSLITTDHDVQNRLFTTFWATSAATALAANFAAKVYSRYPDLRPETVRGLIVHSAQWNDALKAQIQGKLTPKQLAAKLMRRVGYGVPNLEVALDSASQRVSVIIEDEITPFKKGSSAPSLNELVTHDLPWPKEILQDLGALEVKLTVTLSYFIEPNPSNRAFSNKYSYQSHNLLFDLKRALEGPDDLVLRINNADDRREEFQPQNDTGNWLIGPQNRAHGSIAKDIWTGTAADLAERNQIAIIPTAGWWKTRAPLKMYEETTRYSLILTIETPESDIDIYSAVKAIVEAQVEARVEIEV
ncbi:S8 family peptidase [Aliidiomarina halalkaliphila]|uniref:S8 family peptidase n=1 Tax=Aliidiomarina halalkaliphila TaxID=2593535 RepID=A0A552X0F6_9GAMM|nr:S8 family peptidase [Aliidiomarina halalkaliphila]TRW48359.1 S8 family peptidase [Aliidiomarina halalkaliphila]